MTNFRKTYEFISDKQAQKDYNDEIVRKTWHYQNKYGFQTSSKKGNEFWNNEADAFKHAYMSADLSLKNGDLITKPNDTRKQQMKTIGIPYNREVPKGTKTYGKEKSSRNSSSSSTSEDGRWVTINGNHVFIED